MKKIKMITLLLVSFLVISSHSAQAQCECTGSNVTDVIHYAPTGEWLYTIVYTTDGCLVDFKYNATYYQLYGINYPIQSAAAELLSNNKVSEFKMPASCFGWKEDVVIPQDGGKFIIRMFDVCQPGCCVYYKENIVNGLVFFINSDQSTPSSCPPGCTPLCQD